MGRSPCCEPAGLKRGAWTAEEDQKLLAYIQLHGHGSWRSLPQKAGLRRCGKSCRLRWTNYLRPDIKRGRFNSQEDRTIIQLHALLGNRWSAIATHLPYRTDNEIKNYWNTHLKKRLTQLGIDPATHKRECFAATISHMAQWETARLEAEARLVRESKRRRIQSSPPKPLRRMAAAATAPCLDVLKASQIVWSRPTSGAAAAAEARNWGSGFVGRCNPDPPKSVPICSENSFKANTYSGGGDGEELWKLEGFNITEDGNLVEGFVNLLGDQSFSGGRYSAIDGDGAQEGNREYWSDLLSSINCGSPPDLAVI